MRKISFFCLFCAFVAQFAYGDNNNVPTSLSYVESKLSGKLDKLPGLGNNKMLMYTTTSDTEHQVGTPRDIVNTLGDVSNGDYTDTTGSAVVERGAIKAGIDAKQDAISGTTDYVAVYTSTAGTLDEKPIYGTNTNYADALVTAGSVNDAIVDAVNSELTQIDASGNASANGMLWKISDDITVLGTVDNNSAD